MSLDFVTSTELIEELFKRNKQTLVILRRDIKGEDNSGRQFAFYSSADIVETIGIYEYAEDYIYDRVILTDRTDVDEDEEDQE